MRKYNYNIELDTEIGKRFGTMQLFVDGTKINGFMSILKHEEPLFGDISTDGNCKLYGKIVTLIKEITYTATGEFHDEELYLNVQLGKSNYKLKGIATDEIDKG